MEIKELVPKSKEIIVQPKDKGIFCDAFSYEISGSPKNGDSSTSLTTSGKKYFYMVSQVQSGDSSLDYIPNLIATFIKRELEENPGQEQLFEKSLKKTNELIEGLLKENNGLKLDFGVAFIDKEKVAVSKIGKAKMLAYRTKTKDVFDVFENASPVRGREGPQRAFGSNGTAQTSSKRFSNIVSGEIKKGDRFFFFIPNSRLNFKQKLINATMVKSVEGAFLENIHKIAAPPLNLSGIYFEIKEELNPVRSSLAEVGTGLAPSGASETPNGTVVATEVAKISRSDTLKRTSDKFREMIMGGDSKDLESRKWKLIKSKDVSNYLIAAFIGAALIAGLIFLTKGSSKLKGALNSINEKLKISESRLLLKQNYEARKFLGEAIAELNALEENEKKEKVRLAALSLMNRIEKIDSSIQPSPVPDSDSWIKNILAGAEALDVPTSQIWLKDSKIIAYSPGADIKIIDLKNNKTTEIKKKFSFEPVDFKNYEDNLYFLGPKNIYKITNALLKPKEELEWLKPNEAAKISGNFVAFDLDSSIYALTDDRKMVVMFKGEAAKIVDLDFEVRPGAELIDLGNREFLAVDKELKLARMINDAGELKVGYDLSPINSIKDVFFDKESRTLYLLSPAAIWSLKI